MTKDKSQPWPIAHSELTGRYRFSRRGGALGIVAFLLMLILNVGLLIFVFDARPPYGEDLRLVLSIWITAITWVIMGVGGALWWRARIRWDAVGPKVWDADGCLCPWCKADVRSEACGAHGVDFSHRDLLIAHYASPMLGNSGQALQRLVEAVPNPPRRTRLSARSHGWLMRQIQTIRNRDTDSATRRSLIVNLSLMWYAFLGLILAVVIYLVPGGLRFILTSGLAGSVLLILPVFLIFDFTSMVPPRCQACRQQCFSLSQELCGECGADLRKPGAINRRKLNPSRVVGVAPILIGLYALPFLLSFIVAQLPTPARNAVWGEIGAPPGYFSELDLSTMNLTQVKEEADLTLHLARPDGPGIKIFQDRLFIAHALKNDLIPEVYRERAARTTVSASIRFEDDGENQQIVVIPRIAPPLLGHKQPRLAFGGISIDGGPWSVAAERTLCYYDYNEEWHYRTSSRFRRPESEMTFRVPVDLEPGRHSIVALCWIVIDGWGLKPLNLPVDADGQLRFSTYAYTYDLLIETTVEARER